MKAVILAGGLGTRISEETHLKLQEPLADGVDPWDAAQLESVFKDDEDWGAVLEGLILTKNS